MVGIPRSKDFWAGLLFIGIAVFALSSGSNLEFGTARQMGPGYFPAIIAGILLILGGLTMARGFRANDTIEAIHTRPFLILLAVFLFAASVQSLGFVFATSLMVVVGSYALPAPRIVLVAAAAIGLSFFVWLVFVVGLGVPLKAWPF